MARRLRYTKTRDYVVVERLAAAIAGFRGQSYGICECANKESTEILSAGGSDSCA